MRFVASWESDAPAFDAVMLAHRLVVPHLQAEFAKPRLSEFDALLRYVPIIMPPGMKERYPARSRLRRAEGAYSCCPQLDYEVFVAGTVEEQLRAYAGGISLAGRHLPKLGCSKEQQAAFDAILADAPATILATYRPEDHPPVKSKRRADGPRLPEAVHKFSIYFHQDTDLVYRSLDHAISLAVTSLSVDERRTLANFFGAFLSDPKFANLAQGMWTQSSAEIGFAQPEGLIAFLTKVREAALADDISEGDPTTH